MRQGPKFFYAIEGFEKLDLVNVEDPKIQEAMRRALNKAAKHFRTRAERLIRGEVNFPAGYLRPSEGRLFVREMARKDSLQATVSGRIESTSLARFKTNRNLAPGVTPRGGKVGIRVKKGGPVRKFKRAFLIRLRSGNTGFAIRTSGGEPKGAYVPKEISKNLFLLYGPSVNQTLLQASKEGGVAIELTPETLNVLEKEFDRQLEVLGVI